MNEMILFVIGFAVTLVIVVAADIMLAKVKCDTTYSLLTLAVSVFALTSLDSGCRIWVSAEIADRSEERRVGKECGS